MKDIEETRDNILYQGSFNVNDMTNLKHQINILIWMETALKYHSLEKVIEKKKKLRKKLEDELLFEEYIKK